MGSTALSLPETKCNFANLSKSWKSMQRQRLTLLKVNEKIMRNSDRVSWPLNPRQSKTRVISIHPKQIYIWNMTFYWQSGEKRDRVSRGISRAIYPGQQANLVTINLDNQSTNNQLDPPTPTRPRKKKISNLCSCCHICTLYICTDMSLYFL